MSSQHCAHSSHPCAPRWPLSFKTKARIRKCKPQQRQCHRAPTMSHSSTLFRSLHPASVPSTRTRPRFTRQLQQHCPMGLQPASPLLSLSLFCLILISTHSNLIKSATATTQVAHFPQATQESLKASSNETTSLPQFGAANSSDTFQISKQQQSVLNNNNNNISNAQQQQSVASNNDNNNNNNMNGQRPVPSHISASRTPLPRPAPFHRLGKVSTQCVQLQQVARLQSRL